MTDATLYEDIIETPLGAVRLRFDAAGLHEVEIARTGGSCERGAPAARRTYPHRAAFERYFAGDLHALEELPVVMHGSDFQRRVWQALRSIPAGQTRSYGELARSLGNAKASRAVGSANGRNPLCIVVPCHRVISADGTLGGFSAGLDKKRWLLNHEGAGFRD